MKTTFFQKLAIALPLILALCAPYAAFANSNAVNANVWNPSILKGPLVTCTGTAYPGGSSPQANPIPQCTSLCDLISTFANVAYFSIGVVIWIVIPIMVALSGIMFMLSRGNPGKMSDARKMITGTVIGLLIALCAYLIVFTFINILGIAGSVAGFGSNVCPLQVNGG